MKHAFTIATLHLAPPALSAWTMFLWDHGHHVLALLMGGCAFVATVGLWYRVQAAEELAEAYGPTKVWHDRATVEPPRPLPAFDDQPSRIRIKPIGDRIESVAPPDADQESTWTDREVG